MIDRQDCGIHLCRSSKASSCQPAAAANAYRFSRWIIPLSFAADHEAQHERIDLPIDHDRSIMKYARSSALGRSKSSSYTPSTTAPAVAAALRDFLHLGDNSATYQMMLRKTEHLVSQSRRGEVQSSVRRGSNLTDWVPSGSDICVEYLSICGERDPKAR
jgi:hypothetical protein